MPIPEILVTVIALAALSQTQAADIQPRTVPELRQGQANDKDSNGAPVIMNQTKTQEPRTNLRRHNRSQSRDRRSPHSYDDNP